jgi:flagellar biosynthesis/type III secretory pathway M-ring protein FliF/YscJ
MMHVIVAVYVISAVVLLVIYFLVNRKTRIPRRTARRSDRDERAMKTEKEKRKEEEKQTSKPQDLVPKKDAKGGWGVGGTTPIGFPPPAPLG